MVDYIITYSIQIQIICAFLSARHPEVALKEVPWKWLQQFEVIPNIHSSVIWKKGKECIDITQPKYDGSSVGGDSPVLCNWSTERVRKRDK